MKSRKMNMRGISDPRVLDAVERVPRHLFVPKEREVEAYGDYPLPIGYGQTISQPYIVALMTELLELKETDKVLEIGTGSGYQAAILSLLAKEVYSVERIPALADAARERLERLGYRNVHIRVDDGYSGWREHAPYDAIMLTCAAEDLPPPLTAQLADGGRLVAPVGKPYGYQRLILVSKKGGEVRQRDVTGVVFVPLRRGTERNDDEAR